MAYQPFSDKEIRRFFAFSWLFAFILLQFILQYFLGLSWAVAFSDNILFIILLIFTVGIANKSSYLSKLQGYQFIPACLVLSLFAVLCIALHTFILYSLNQSNEAYLTVLFQILPFRFLYTWFVIIGFTFMNYVWQRLSERKKAHEKAESLRKMAKEAELDKIYQQLHPHFLFNSLNAINTLIETTPQKASDMIQQLSDFLRGSLKSVNEEFILFQDEIQHLNLYLALEEIRFGERLKTIIELDQSTSKSTIPPLILQPLIENAIKFGLYGTLGKVTIQLKSHADHNHLYLSISNPFDEDAQPPKGTGFGLKSVKRRLFLLYGRSDLVQTEKKENIFTTCLKIPQYDGQSLNHWWWSLISRKH